MQPPTLIYYGPPDLQSQVIASYFAKLGCGFQITTDLNGLVVAVHTVPRPVVILAQEGRPAELIGLARQVIDDPSSAFPHVFILNPGENFDARLEAITVISGASRLPHLASHIRALLRQ